MMSQWSWVPHVLSIELKKAFSYRVAFWVQFLIGTGADLSISYFLWWAIFQARGESTIQGFTFHGLILYYVFATFSSKITRGNDRGYISTDIYEGTLTRYLLYPLPFFPYKLVTHFTQQLLGMIQLLFTLSLFALIIGLPGGNHVTVFTFLAGCFTCVLAGYLHFTMMSCLEMVAFWQDVVWNLMVMLRFMMNLLGGQMIPLAFFPEWGQKIIAYTPFPALVSFPARTFLGDITLNEWLWQAGMLALWALVFTFLANRVWIRGTKQYSGVGI